MTSDALNSNDVLMKKIAAAAGDNNVLDSLWENPTTAKQQALILNEAILNDQVETVRFLLEEKNIDPNTKFAGTNSLFWAQQRGNSEIIKLVSNAINNTTLEVEQEFSPESEIVTFETSADYYPYITYAPFIVGVAALGALHQISLHKNSYDVPNPFAGLFNAAVGAVSSYVSSFNPFSAVPKVTIAAATAVTKVIEEAQGLDLVNTQEFNKVLVELLNHVNGGVSQEVSDDIGAKLVGQVPDAPDDYVLVD